MSRLLLYTCYINGTLLYKQVVKTVLSLFCLNKMCLSEPQVCELTHSNLTCTVCGRIEFWGEFAILVLEERLLLSKAQGNYTYRLL